MSVIMLSFPSFVFAETPSTCVLQWATIHTPGSFPERNDIRSPCELNEIAVSSPGKIIYAIDTPNCSTGPVVKAGIWKSTDGGISWNLRPTKWLVQASPPPDFPVTDIAIAPDDPDFVAVICADAAGTPRREVYLSSDGGNSWSYSGSIPFSSISEQIGDIAISKIFDYAGHAVRDIIIGSRNPVDGLGQGEIYILKHPGIYNWKGQNFNNGDIITLAVSPSYVSDQSILAMSSSSQRTYINTGYRDSGADISTWNIIPGWPVELCPPDQAGGINSGESRIITGCLSLPSDFNNAIMDKRIIFASYDSNGLSMGTSRQLDDVYRLNDTVVTRLNMPGYGNNPRISSIAFNGTSKSGKLMTGGVRADASTASSIIWVTSTPLSSCPVWTKPLKTPTGGFGSGFANARLAWTQDGTVALCGTGSGNRDTPAKWSDPSNASWSSQALDESAFSISQDNGTSWNQTSLIDTRIHRFRALTASGDGKTVYISSVNDNGLDSTWRSASQIAGEIWQRIYCTDCPSPVLRLAPDEEDGSVLFLGKQATIRILSSRDSGQTWFECLPNALLQDFAASDKDNLLVLQANGLCRHGHYNGYTWIWDKFSDTGLSVAHTIAVQQHNALAGASLGQVCPLAYSHDYGISWNKISEPSPGIGNRHVAFDQEFKDNNLIYLADDAGGLYRWTLGRSNRWDDMSPPGNSYYGISIGDDGMLYATFSPAAGGVDRTTYSQGGIPKPGLGWDSLTTGLTAGVVFRLEPSSLVLADDTLWAVDARDYDPWTTTGCLWAFKDTLAGHSPWLIAPKNNSLIYCDPVSGRNGQVDLKWQQLSLADSYQIEIGKDEWFDLRVEEAEPPNNPFYMPADVLYPAYYIADGLLPEAGKDYYWRVRVRRAATGQVIRSRWSPDYKFSVQPGYPVAAPSYPGILPLQPNQNACDIPVYPLAFSWTPLQKSSSYRLILAADPELKTVLLDKTVHSTSYAYQGKLNDSTAYYWQVAALEPVPSDPSPVFTFTTEAANIPASHGQTDETTTHVLLIMLIVVWLVGLCIQVIIYRNK